MRRFWYCQRRHARRSWCVPFSLLFCAEYSSFPRLEASYTSISDLLNPTLRALTPTLAPTLLITLAPTAPSHRRRPYFLPESSKSLSNRPLGARIIPLPTHPRLPLLALLFQRPKLPLRTAPCLSLSPMSKIPSSVLFPPTKHRPQSQHHHRPASHPILLQ